VSTIGAAQLEDSYVSAGNDRGYHVIDVRTADEFAGGHVPGATHMHVGHLPRRMEELSRDERLVVYCQSGHRSGIAASLLLSAGIQGVTNLRGGFSAWEERSQAPVERARA